MSTDLAIEVHDLTRRYGKGNDSFTAVDAVNFDVRRGELFALLGTNGAGKTSTLEVVEGLAQPAAGSVRVLGHDPVGERAKVRPSVGVMLQDTGFTAELTVKETATSWHNTLERSVGVNAALEMVDLDHRSDVRVPSLSGGERRRLDLALALMNVPELVFLDEPTTGLDPQSRQVTWNLVRSLLSHGTTLMLTTHYLEEAESMADRIAIMHEGSIARYGTVAEIVATEPERISFAASPEAQSLPLAALAGVIARPTQHRGTVTIETENLQRTLFELLAEADRNGVVLKQLDARSASLEQAFLSVAGASSTHELDAAA